MSAILTPLQEIEVPSPKADEVYAGEYLGRSFAFPGLKRLLGAADYSKAGDRHAGLAAKDEVEREAARSLLASLSLQHLYDRPLTDENAAIDAVMRVNYQIDRELFQTLADRTVGELKNLLLRQPGKEVARIGGALTGVMAAAVAKLMDVHELVYVARKILRPTKARTRLGLPGSLSSRLQPNHPTDDLRGITMLTYAGLSMAAGDALFGINPAVDTVDHVATLLRHLDQIRRRLGVPTQICVLAHIKTQLACLAQGAPVEILFQSLAGTERTCTTEFDITIDLLDAGYRAMKEKGPLREVADQFMYFETGQGSELTYGKHNGIDMCTAEALCYGLARRYDPFMVNNVTGFIGPETHLDNHEMILSNLQDHFMGKLLGLPMGMAPCYTLHSQITLEGQQMATQLLTAAGANYYMDVCLNTDRMLAYFDTSAHDDQTLREIHDRRPTPEYLEWALERGILTRDVSGRIERGPSWGDPRQFCESDTELAELMKATPVVYGWEHAGARPIDAVSREVRRNQAAARNAIYTELEETRLGALGSFRVIETQARDKQSHLGNPSLGATLTFDHRAALQPESAVVQILVSDGLSAEAIHENADELFPVLLEGLRAKGLSVGKPLVARHGRVKLAEEVATCLGTLLTILLIGERPGGEAAAARSLSAYLVFQLLDEKARHAAAKFSGNPDCRFEYSVVSNIYSGGLVPVEAASVIVEKAAQIIKTKAAGNRLEVK